MLNVSSSKILAVLMFKQGTCVSDAKERNDGDSIRKKKRQMNKEKGSTGKDEGVLHELKGKLDAVLSSINRWSIVRKVIGVMEKVTLIEPFR